jgi:hypothetical protein
VYFRPCDDIFVIQFSVMKCTCHKKVPFGAKPSNLLKYPRLILSSGCSKMMKLHLLHLVSALGLSNLAFGNAASPSHTQYSFGEFLHKFGKKYDTAEEYNRRQDIFLSNLSKIRGHNDHRSSEHSYMLGINQFADLLEEELPMGLDKSLYPSYARTSFSEKRQLRSTSPLEKQLTMITTDFDINDLPESVDWRLEGSITTAVKNQGMCGSCWAFAATAALESHIAIQTGKLFDLSVQELVSCAPNTNWCGGSGGCTGSTAELAYEYIAQHGILEEWRFAYQSFNGAKVNCTVLEVDENNRKTVEGAGEFTSRRVFVYAWKFFLHFFLSCVCRWFPKLTDKFLQGNDVCRSNYGSHRCERSSFGMGILREWHFRR